MELVQQQEHEAVFPLDTQVEYALDYREDDDDLDDYDHHQKFLQDQDYRDFIQKALKSEGKFVPFQEHTVEELRAVSDLQAAFNALLSAEDDVQREAIFQKFRTIHDQTLPQNNLSFLIGIDGWPRNEAAKKYNELYAQTIITLIDKHVDELKQAHQGKALISELAQFYKKIANIPYMRMHNGPEKKAPEVQNASVDGYLADIKGEFSRLKYLAEYGTVNEFDEHKSEVAKHIGQTRNVLAQEKTTNSQSETKLQEFNRRLSEYLSEINLTNLKYSGEFSPENVRLREKQETQRLIEKGIDKLLVSTSEYVTMIHRTDINSAQNIVEKGFATNYSIESTASSSSSNRDVAINQYLHRHKNDTAVVILRIPRSKYREIDQRGILPEIKKPNMAGITTESGVIPPSWIVGYVERENTELVKSPHFEDKDYDKTKPWMAMDRSKY